MTLTQLIIIGLLVESVVETIKMAFEPKKVNKWMLVSMGIGILLAFQVQADILLILGFTGTIPYLGIILTGILFSRGSNWIHDLIKKIQGYNSNEIETINEVALTKANEID